MLKYVKLKKLWRPQAGVKIRQINFSEFYTWPNLETADGKNKNFGILKMTKKMKSLRNISVSKR